MKTVVLEIRGKRAAVLSDDGRISQVRNRNYRVGEEIVLNAEQHEGWSSRWVKSVAGMAAALLIFSGGSVWAYYTPYSYVSIDINPSIEYTINRADRVLSAKAINAEANEMIAHIDYNHKRIYAVIDETMKEFGKDGYLVDKNGDGILDGIIVSAFSKSPKHQLELISGLRTELQRDVFGENKILTEQQKRKDGIQVIGVDRKKVEEAHAFGVTPGKMNLIKSLKSSAKDPASIDVQNWTDKSTEDILAAINENKKNTGLNPQYDVDVAEEDYNADTKDHDVSGDGGKTIPIDKNNDNSPQQDINNSVEGSGDQNGDSGDHNGDSGDHN